MLRSSRVEATAGTGSESSSIGVAQSHVGSSIFGIDVDRALEKAACLNIPRSRLATLPSQHGRTIGARQ